MQPLFPAISEVKLSRRGALMISQNLLCAVVLVGATLLTSCTEEAPKAPPEVRAARSYSGTELPLKVASRAKANLQSWRRILLKGDLAPYAGTIFDPGVKTVFEARCARNAVWRAALESADMQTSATEGVSVAGRTTVTAWIRDRATERIYLVAIDPESELCAGAAHDAAETRWTFDGDGDLAAVLLAGHAIERSMVDPGKLHGDPAAKAATVEWLRRWSESATLAAPVSPGPEDQQAFANAPDEGPLTTTNAVLAELAAMSALTPDTLKVQEESVECSGWRAGMLVCETANPPRALCLGGHECERIGYLFSKEGQLRSARMVVDGPAFELELANAHHSLGEPEVRVTPLNGPCHARATATFRGAEGSLALERVQCSATMHAYYGTGGAVIAELPLNQ